MSDFLAQMTKALGVQGRYITVVRPTADYGVKLVQERLIPNLAAPQPLIGDRHWTFRSSTAYLEVEPGWYAALSFIDASKRWEDHYSPCHCASDGTLLRADEFSDYWETANIWTTLDIPVVEDLHCGDDEEDDEDWDDDDDDYSDEPDDEDPF